MGEKQKTRMHQLQSEPPEGSRETIERELARQESRAQDKKTKPKSSPDIKGKAEKRRAES